MLAITVVLCALSFNIETTNTSSGSEQPHRYMIANYTLKDQETFKNYMEAY